MENPELSISVGELIGVPRVTLRGRVEGWHDQAISGILTGFRDQGTTSLVLDITSLTFAGMDGAAGMIRVLRSLGPQICVHLLASGTPRSLLSKAEIGPCIRLYSNTDEIAEHLAVDEEFYTSRWMAAVSDDTEMPLAA